MPTFPLFREGTQKHEWIGSRYTFPVAVHDGKEVVLPEIILWMEMPARVLVGSKAFDPRAPTTLAETLDDAMRYPTDGPPRRPLRIRVPDEQMAGELRRTFRGIPIIVAPVPELDEIFEELSAAANREANPSYLGGGATPAIVGEFFGVAISLFRAAPWHQLEDRQIIAVDIPAFDIRDACLSVIGAAGESFGLLLFRSMNDFWSFALRLERADEEEVEEGDDAIALRSLSFDRKKDMPPSLMREIREHGWPVAGTKAYPTLICLDGAMNPVEATERDFRIMTALAHAFLSFYELHADIFDAEDPGLAVFTSDGEIEVTLTAPHPVVALDDDDDSSWDDDPFVEPPLITRSVGRNDPCPCGSGKKYKKCHLEANSR